MSEIIEVKTRYAGSLAEIYREIEDISNNIDGSVNTPLFWFRGHRSASYNLIPSIMRDAKDIYNQNNTYGNNRLREEYRFQCFMARNFDNLNYRMPQSLIEWQEVMQHYLAKTRLMDWSESLTTALLFALEDFIKPGVPDAEISKRRTNADPVLWILRPDKLNETVYSSFADNSVDLICKAIRLYKGNKYLAWKIKKEIKENRNIYFSLNCNDEDNMNGTISLSSLEMLRNSYQGREVEALDSFEINPFFFLLLRYYSDGLPVNSGELPPLAIIHPYHSERIRAQKGVFTIFPFYVKDTNVKEFHVNAKSFNANAMEYMEQCVPFLYKIHILDPHRVVKDMLITGARLSNVYPDIANITKEMENTVNSKYY